MKHITLTIILLTVLISYINTTSKTVIAEENHSQHPIPVNMVGIVRTPHLSQSSGTWIRMYCNQMLGTSEECN